MSKANEESIPIVYYWNGFFADAQHDTLTGR